MSKDPKNKRFVWRDPLRQKTIQKNILKAIRNRRGHRPSTMDHNHHDLVIASYNVHKCVGVDKIFDPKRIVRVIAEINADIIAVQETDKRFGERVGLLDLDYLHEETGLMPVPIITMSPNGHGWHGNALFYRNGHVHEVLQVKLPGMEPRGALIAELIMDAGPIRIIAAHFGLLRHSRNRQAKFILSLIEKREIMPTLMIGDLNEWRVGKGSSLTNLAPYFDVTLGTVPSFPSRFPFLALDRVFAFPHQLVSNIKSHYTPLSRVASDHLPIKAQVDLASATQVVKDMVSQAK
ncbi:endonuclease/exonuclease/phosphatase family protein [Bartonella tamiae]|uniref:Endonuclease/exonuclease/phosphatase domain-containing protein n=1 Tax=Bartonella tamiae Th239 TaxID=1094558 RepID=J0QYK3_9HYPH|nr:endonuclease/exonuclease/phosphatase family protein [Bartonella tamiae]EJF91191.1 hypothetical protein ME5_00523 [Bartonella tamiae Th239]EJF93144.1 hypothetical protein MEG_01358 [Bartonella tamiae Th307]